MWVLKELFCTHWNSLKMKKYVPIHYIVGKYNRPVYVYIFYVYVCILYMLPLQISIVFHSYYSVGLAR